MIVYQSTKSDFARDVETGAIDDIILDRFRDAFGFGVGPSERRSWAESLTRMHIVLGDDEIPADSGVGIELKIPQTSKRIDFIVAGRDGSGTDRAVVVELKQWESAERTSMNGIVRTFVGGALREVSHPSYQVWSYVQLLRDFNQEVYEGDIGLHPCAFLHNY